MGIIMNKMNFEKLKEVNRIYPKIGFCISTESID